VSCKKYILAYAVLAFELGSYGELVYASICSARKCHVIVNDELLFYKSVYTLNNAISGICIQRRLLGQLRGKDFPQTVKKLCEAVITCRLASEYTLLGKK